MRLARVVALLAVSAPLFAQTERDSYRFEVVSVKPNRNSDPGVVDLRILPGGKLLVRNAPLFMIVALAYDVPFQSPRLTGGKEWRDTELLRFDIDGVPAKADIPPDLSRKVREQRVRLMMRALLADRFHLKMRIESREQPVYELTVAKGGPKLTKARMTEPECEAAQQGSQPSPCHKLGGGQGRGIHAKAVELSEVALFVQNWSDRPVIDRTGLTDLYDIDTAGWLPMRLRVPSADGATPKGDAGVNDPDQQTLFDVFRQLGIAMTSQKGAVDMYVVESVAPASAN